MNEKNCQNHEILDRFGNDPIALCKIWMAEAEESEPNDPDAVCLATASAEGVPKARMVLIKEVSDAGLKFHTNAESQKGCDLNENPQAALCFYWKSLRKQIRVNGRVEFVSEEEADEYFSGRPRGRQIGAWASDQSRSFEKWKDLEAKIAGVEKRFEGQNEIPRPSYWKGYRVVPQSIEFWIAHRDRLHTRFVYRKEEGGLWHVSWLYP